MPPTAIAYVCEVSTAVLSYLMSMIGGESEGWVIHVPNFMLINSFNQLTRNILYSVISPLGSIGDCQYRFSFVDETTMIWGGETPTGRDERIQILTQQGKIGFYLAVY